MNDSGVPWYEFKRQPRPSVLILTARNRTLQESKREDLPLTIGLGRGRGSVLSDSRAHPLGFPNHERVPLSLPHWTHIKFEAFSDRIRITVIAGSIY